MERTIPRFWMVIRLEGNGSGATSTRHGTYELAATEAYRLAMMHSASFVVLTAFEVCVPIQPIVDVTWVATYTPK